MRILNRMAQRYLVRRGTPLPVVGIPGSDLSVSTDWEIRAAIAPTCHIVSATDVSQSLQVRSGTLVLDSDGSIETGHGFWRLEPVGNGTSCQYIVDAADSSRGLIVVGEGGRALDDLAVTVGSIRRDDRRAMWFFDEQAVADVRSVHLRYEAPSGLALLYNEIHPLAAPPGTFFCMAGFGIDARGLDPGGYAGVQELVDGTRIAIFSVWHRLIDDERPVADARATAVAVNAGAYETPFSGEGSGTSIRLPFDWWAADDQPIRLVVTAEPLADDTVLTAYIARGRESWISLGAILRAGTGGRLMSRPYGFIEDFARTGNTEGIAVAERSPYRLRAAQFANPWFGVGPVATGLEPLTRATVTAYSPHPLENLAAEPSPSPAGFGILLSTGTPAADQRPPIGAAFADPAPHKRIRPHLDGVPYL